MHPKQTRKFTEADLSFAEANRLFTLDPSIPHGLRWKPNNGHFITGNKPVGTLEGDGYYRVKLNGRGYKNHRLIFFLHNGRWPAANLDHRSRCKTENGIENLREATRSQNEFNKTLRKDNGSGYKGVSWNKRRSRWEAKIRDGGAHRHLGYFSTAEGAFKSYEVAAKQLHGEFYVSATIHSQDSQ